ncbi:MAG TPA: thioredoxin domain-containing protein [Candidatus Paceibacterota bacterium]
METQKQSYSIPVAIVLAGALIAGGIYMSNRPKAAPVAGNQQPTAQAVNIKGVTADDHVLGDRNAPIMIVEYSDIECPFCKNFHATLHALVDEYKGQVAWAFRHFPVHENSVKEGEAAECAAEVGGNDAFWKYTDKIFAETKSNNGIDLARLPGIAKDIGLDTTKFNACLNSGKYASKIEQQRMDVINAGAGGTPYSVIFAKGEKIPLTQGALPYADMKTIIDTIIKN